MATLRTGVFVNLFNNLVLLLIIIFVFIFIHKLKDYFQKAQELETIVSKQYRVKLKSKKRQIKDEDKEKNLCLKKKALSNMVSRKS